MQVARGAEGLCEYTATPAESPRRAEVGFMQAYFRHIPLKVGELTSAYLADKVSKPCMLVRRTALLEDSPPSKLPRWLRGRGLSHRMAKRSSATTELKPACASSKEALRTGMLIHRPTPCVCQIELGADRDERHAQHRAQRARRIFLI